MESKDADWVKQAVNASARIALYVQDEIEPTRDALFYEDLYLVLELLTCASEKWLRDKVRS